MKTVIHLKTARVYAVNEDSTPKIERTVVKLEDGDNFLKFVKHMHLKGFIKNDPPVVVKVMEKDKNGKYQEIDKLPWQKVVQAELDGKKPQGKIDYKMLSEKQASLLQDMQNRLAALENKDKSGGEEKSENRISIESKAKELNINFRANIGDAKLLEKINDIDPDFQV